MDAQEIVDVLENGEWTQAPLSDALEYCEECTQGYGDGGEVKVYHWKSR